MIELSRLSVTPRGVRHDSRHVQAGDVFVALRGERFDGARFAARAVARGACAVIAHQPLDVAVPVITVSDTRRALATAAHHVYRHPSRALDVVGITGTNGKTTTSHLLHSALRACGERPAILGTLGLSFDDPQIQESSLNTPEADELARSLAKLAQDGASHLVMEVTSHAIAQHRVDAMRFAVAAFSNITHDHLDLHGSFAAYAAAKRRLFAELEPERAVVMVDDELGAEIAQTYGALSVSLHPDSDADIRPAAAPRCDAGGSACNVHTPSGAVELTSQLLGMHNVSNMLLALGIAHALELDLETAARAIASATPVPGRLERCHVGEGVIALVDYAHTPDALDKALTAARLLTPSGRVVCVFGCGGDRDPSKRAPMGDVAGRLADLTIITNDNPRDEDPTAIAETIVEGLEPHRRGLHVELDRARAIELALEEARPGDVILVAGKGHETTQTIAGDTCPFDDRDVLAKLSRLPR